MAAIENLEIVVDVDIGEAVAKLSELQDELQDLAESIERVDAQGTEGISIRTDLDDVDDDLAALKAKIEAFEASNDINIDTDTDSQLGEMLQAFTNADLDFGGFDIDSTSPKPEYGDLFETFGDADLDFGDFNVERGAGIGTGDGGADEGGLLDTFRDMRRSIDKMTDNVSTFDLRMSDMHNMLARLIPLLLVFIGTIPAVVTALVGLASAAIAAAASLLAIAGFGAMGVGLVGGQFDMQRITDMLETVRSDFIEAFAPLAERLQPIFEDAIDGLGRFFQTIADQGQALMSLTDEARAFGGFIMDFVPGALRTLAALVEALSPIFANIGQSIDSNFSNIVRTLVALTAQTVPIIAKMAQRIAGALPAIIRMSIGFAQVANQVIRFIGAIFRLFEMIGIGPRMFGLLTAAILAAATAVALFNTAVVQATIGGLMRFGAMIIGTIGKLLGYSAANAIATLATWGLYQALAALIGLTGVGLLLVGLSAGVSQLGSNFSGAASDVDSLTSSLKNFDRVSGRTDAAGMNPYGGEPPSSGAAAAGGSGARSGGGTSVTVNVESSGDDGEDASNARYTAWRTGRTTGGNN